MFSRSLIIADTREAVTAMLQYLTHLIGSTVGISLSAAFLTYSTVISLHQFYPSIGDRTVHWILTETPYFPVQILLGLLYGFLLSRRFGHATMLWVWLVPALAIVCLIVLNPVTPVFVGGVELTAIEHFFGWRCLPQNHCFEQVALTLPLYSATAYSLGALVARVTRQVKD